MLHATDRASFHVILPLLALALASACGGDTSRPGGSSVGGSAGTGTGATGTGTTATSASGSGGASASGTMGAASSGGSGSGSSSGGATGGGPSIPVCWQTCDVAEDCAIAGAGPEFDGDNYSCDDGLCVYQGCNDDPECQVTLPGRICHQAQGASISTCTQPCQTVEACAAASPGTQASNWSCEGGGCVWVGCGGDEECPMGFVCRDSTAAVLPGQTGVPGCVSACSVPEDCAIGGGAAFDADNYQCVEGGCAWTGCNSTQECMAGQVCQ